MVIHCLYQDEESKQGCSALIAKLHIYVYLRAFETLVGSLPPASSSTAA